MAGGYWCCCLRCQGCLSRSPQEYLITFTGIANDDCGNCVDYNAAWVVPLISSPSSCTYRLDFDDVLDPDPCPFNGSTPSFLTVTVDTLAFTVTLLADNSSFAWRINWPSGNRDCGGYDAESVPAWAGGTFGTGCDVSAATCTVTAL